MNRLVSKGLPVAIGAAVSFGVVPANAASPVPLANAITPDPAYNCVASPPYTPGFRLQFDGIDSPGAVNEESARCRYVGVSSGDRRGVPAGVILPFYKGVDWADACARTTGGQAIQAGDRSWWCI